MFPASFRSATSLRLLSARDTRPVHARGQPVAILGTIVQVKAARVACLIARGAHPVATLGRLETKLILKFVVVKLVAFLKVRNFFHRAAFVAILSALKRVNSLARTLHAPQVVKTLGNAQVLGVAVLLRVTARLVEATAVEPSTCHTRVFAVANEAVVALLDVVGVVKAFRAAFPAELAAR